MIMQEAFKELASGLSDENRADFFRILHETGISEKDTELAKLLRALQLYKAYYAEIPEAIQKAVDEVKRLTRRAERIGDAGEESLNLLLQHAAQVDESLKKIHAHVEEASDKAAASVSSRMTAARDKIKTQIEDTSDKAAVIVSERMTAAMENALPLASLLEAGKVFSDVVSSGRQAYDELQKNIKIVRRVHYRAYALTACALILIFWAFTHFRYEARLADAGAAIVNAVDDNRDVLLELAKTNRRLELSVSEKGNTLLFIRDANGWTSTNNYGVIEFKE